MNSSARSMASSTRSYLSPHRLATEFDCTDTTMTRLSLCRKVALGALSATKNTTSVPERSFQSQQARRTASGTSETFRCARRTSTRTLNSSPTGSKRSEWWRPNAKTHAYEVRPRKDHREVELISDAPAFGRLWYSEPKAVSNAIDYAKHRSCSHNALIRVCDDSRNVIIPKTRRPVPKHATRYGVPFTLIGSQQLSAEQLTAEADFMARGVQRLLVSTKQIL
jgi:hypothetical protein